MVCYLVQCPQFELLPSPYRAIVTYSLLPSTGIPSISLHKIAQKKPDASLSSLLSFLLGVAIEIFLSLEMV